MPDIEGASQSEATAALRRTGFAVSVRTEESWEIPEGRVISSDVAGGDEATRPGPIGIVVSSGPPRASVPDVRGVDVDDAVARLDGSFDTSVVEEGSETAPAGSVLRQSPDPGTRAVLGSTVTLTVARAPEWGTTWSQSGSGSYDSDDIEVTAPQGKWRIVVDLHPRYLIFGSGSAAVSWEGTGAGSISLDSVGSDEVAPLSGAGTYRSTCTRRAASAGPCGSSSSARSNALPALELRWAHASRLRLLWCRRGERSPLCGRGRRPRRALAARSIELVTGGGKVGLMGVVADATLAAGGR